MFIRSPGRLANEVIEHVIYTCWANLSHCLYEVLVSWQMRWFTPVITRQFNENTFKSQCVHIRLTSVIYFIANCGSFFTQKNNNSKMPMRLQVHIYFTAFNKTKSTLSMRQTEGLTRTLAFWSFSFQGMCRLYSLLSSLQQFVRL